MVGNVQENERRHQENLLREYDAMREQFDAMLSMLKSVHRSIRLGHLVYQPNVGGDQQLGLIEETIDKAIKR
jgi:hypothetical protein